MIKKKSAGFRGFARKLSRTSGVKYGIIVFEENLRLCPFETILVKLQQKIVRINADWITMEQKSAKIVTIWVLWCLASVIINSPSHGFNKVKADNISFDQSTIPLQYTATMSSTLIPVTDSVTTSGATYTNTTRDLVIVVFLPLITVLLFLTVIVLISIYKDLNKKNLVSGEMMSDKQTEEIDNHTGIIEHTNTSSIIAGGTEEAIHTRTGVGLLKGGKLNNDNDNKRWLEAILANKRSKPSLLDQYDFLCGFFKDGHLKIKYRGKGMSCWIGRGYRDRPSPSDSTIQLFMDTEGAEPVVISLPLLPWDDGIIVIIGTGILTSAQILSLIRFLYSRYKEDVTGFTSSIDSNVHQWCEKEEYNQEIAVLIRREVLHQWEKDRAYERKFWQERRDQQ